MLHGVLSFVKLTDNVLNVSNGNGDLSVDHPDLEDDKGLMRDDKDQIAEDCVADPLHDADENFGTPPVSPASEGKTPSNGPILLILNQQTYLKSCYLMQKSIFTFCHL